MRLASNCPVLLQRHSALVQRNRAPLWRYRALLQRHRALLQRYRALSQKCETTLKREMYGSFSYKRALLSMSFLTNEPYISWKEALNLRSLRALHLFCRNVRLISLQMSLILHEFPHKWALNFLKTSILFLNFEGKEPYISFAEIQGSYVELSKSFFEWNYLNEYIYARI